MGKSEVSKRWSVGSVSWQVGRRVLITGANSGIGFETALVMAGKGAHVLLGCRDESKGKAALVRLRRRVPDGSAEVVRLDLASLASIRAFAEAEVASNVQLDLLINNAGVYAPKRRMETSDGFELQFGTNVLGHFALTALLYPALVLTVQSPSEKPRVVTIASIAHKRAKLNFDDLQSEKSYSPTGSYGQSKLANLMFSFELARRLRDAGPPAKGIMSVAAHPGVAKTNLFVAGKFDPLERMMRRGAGFAIQMLLNSEAQGALPTLFAATSPQVVDGGYYGPQGLLEMRGGDVGEAEVAPQALDREAAARLWSECERLTGIRFL
ncbi:MAG: oxidoreductase [Acidobacteriota bacterium]|nr:oxidoreductase [Acidobacteriota bacterium]